MMVKRRNAFQTAANVIGAPRSLSPSRYRSPIRFSSPPARCQLQEGCRSLGAAVLPLVTHRCGSEVGSRTLKQGYLQGAVVPTRRRHILTYSEDAAGCRCGHHTHQILAAWSVRPLRRNLLCVNLGVPMAGIRLESVVESVKSC